MKCPKCNENINPLLVQSKGFDCKQCGTELIVSDIVTAHLLASVLIVIELLFILSLNFKIYTNILIISVFSLFNYYMSFKTFLAISLKSESTIE